MIGLLLALTNLAAAAFGQMRRETDESKARAKAKERGAPYYRTDDGWLHHTVSGEKRAHIMDSGGEVIEYEVRNGTYTPVRNVTRDAREVERKEKRAEAIREGRSVYEVSWDIGRSYWPPGHRFDPKYQVDGQGHYDVETDKRLVNREFPPDYTSLYMDSDTGYFVRPVDQRYPDREAASYKEAVRFIKKWNGEKDKGKHHLDFLNRYKTPY